MYYFSLHGEDTQMEEVQETAVCGKAMSCFGKDGDQRGGKKPLYIRYISKRKSGYFAPTRYESIVSTDVSFEQPKYTSKSNQRSSDIK